MNLIVMERMIAEADAVVEADVFQIAEYRGLEMSRRVHEEIKMLELVAAASMR